MVVPGPRFCSPGGAWTLTDVGGTFGHHVLVVVDASIWDSGLGLVRRDHKEFLRKEENGKQQEMQGWLEKPQGLQWGVEPGWGLHCFPGNPQDQNRARQGGYQSTLAGKDNLVTSFATCSL